MNENLSFQILPNAAAILILQGGPIAMIPAHSNNIIYIEPDLCIGVHERIFDIAAYVWNNVGEIDPVVFAYLYGFSYQIIYNAPFNYRLAIRDSNNDQTQQYYKMCEHFTKLFDGSGEACYYSEEFKVIFYYDHGEVKITYKFNEDSLKEVLLKILAEKCDGKNI